MYTNETSYLLIAIIIYLLIHVEMYMYPPTETFSGLWEERVTTLRTSAWETSRDGNIPSFHFF